MKRLIIAVLWFPTTLFIIMFFLVLLILSPTQKKKPASESIFGIQNMLNLPQTHPVLNIAPYSDYRKNALSNFLTDYASPLVTQVDVLVREADNNGLDYALIPAIAMQESQLCKIIPYDSYNCWGFGIYGKNVLRFNSYAQAIAKVAKTIKETYIKRGLTNPTLLEDRWAPQSRGTWSYSVNFFISKIREYERSLP